MADLGKQGTAAPVNTAEPIKSGYSVDWENRPTGSAGGPTAGVWTNGTGNNDKRNPR